MLQSSQYVGKVMEKKKMKKTGKCKRFAFRANTIKYFKAFSQCTSIDLFCSMTKKTKLSYPYLAPRYCLAWSFTASLIAFSGFTSSKFTPRPKYLQSSYWKFSNNEHDFKTGIVLSFYELINFSRTWLN